MKLALECPTSLLMYVQPLVDFDWILAHLVLKDKVYAEFYSESTRYKVLDNSVNELLEPLSLAQIREAAEIVRPDRVVAPDFLGDSKKTLEGVEKAVDLFGQESVLPVVQGNSLADVLTCSDRLLSMGFSEVAVPYDITSSRTESLEVMAAGRQAVVGSLENSFLEIHLLGLNCLEELEAYNGSSSVVSIDTGSPVLHGLNSLRFGRDKLLLKSIPTMKQMGNSAGSGIDKETADLESIYYNMLYLRMVLCSI